MKISELSQVAQRNGDMIACSVYYLRIPFVLYSLYIHVTRNTLKLKAVYTCKNIENQELLCKRRNINGIHVIYVKSWHNIGIT